MINAIKQRLVDSGEFVSVQLAEDQEPLDVLSVQTPAVVIYYGKNKYAPSVTDMHVHQAVGKELMVQLICTASDVDAKEKALVLAVIGYIHDAEHEPLQAVESSNHALQGEFYSRMVLFRTQTYIRQS